ncbi:vacuolar segregation subunit 7-domain-containing protein [Durotheca rogersii]|uniref:vacuolar segregation subunit 7-domain-containing protein n=1 Tax=Durotheca rogersii TaxID=419775 RepID=UPI00221E8716|nr:vacuolar segregation subunit 7-domain-containing protein [Durotheca rogersii]KAI5859725.1 vacuolar segregation subunit 7-domain-containing protein [Durotheca rogersii]
MDASLSSLNSVDNETSTTSGGNIDSQASRWTSTSTSLTASPAESREPSPVRPSAMKSGRTSRASSATVRSRKNSLQDPSPSRPQPKNPTPAATSRHQLSAATTPALPPAPSAPDPASRAATPQKPSVAPDAPRWPVSPRLKSPPPHLGRPAAGVSSARRNEHETSAASARATPPPYLESASQSENEVEEVYLSSGMRTPVRGPGNGASTLETVQEVSQPNTPKPGLDAALEKLAAAQEPTPGKSSGASGKKFPNNQNTTNSESGSDSGGVRMNVRRSSTSAPAPPLQGRRSSSTLRFTGRGPTSAESSSKNMTVETEEVKYVPPPSLAPNTGGAGASGNLRSKPSSETIKAKKEKKRVTRKAPAVPSGNARGQPISRSQPTVKKTTSITAHVGNLLTTGIRPASSKADIFEAKIASAVEEAANSSDSDETFVYDSNPPDAGDRPRRYHSRTPSATSMMSQVDRNGMRSIHSVLEGSAPTVPVKKSMKFVNTYNTCSGNEGPFGDDDGRGSGQSNAGSARGTSRHHHYPGRWGRNNSSNHLSLFSSESPFPNAARSKFSGNSARPPSNPPSPRFAGRNWSTQNKRQMALSGYDMDDTTTGADDERAPLMPGGTVRSTRSARARRGGHSRNLEAQTYRQAPSLLNRFASCLVLTVMLLVVISGAIAFMFATSQPLTDIELVKIGNVLASEQELMMDITVRAHNPNVVVVMIDSADLEIFAKSPHAGTDSEWWRRPKDAFGTLDGSRDDPPIVKLPGGGDAPPNPPSDDSSPNMRLGNILAFDSPLTYEGSFFQSGISASTGSLRLSRPGNTTESGSERWERIIADEFTLIVKGVLKYSLPLSQRIRNVAISGKTTVKPNSANNPSLRPNQTVAGVP